jgi:hypothetical protein
VGIALSARADAPTAAPPASGNGYPVSIARCGAVRKRRARSNPLPDRNFRKHRPFCARARAALLEATMHSIIYLVGLIVVVLAILSFFGLR